MLVTRFAPSPTGYLHLGHAASALAAWNRAQKKEGKFLLRLEDIDTSRCRPFFEDAIYEDLQWLGLSWPLDVRRQSAWRAMHASLLRNLQENGFLYRCFCTRKDIQSALSAPHGPDGAVYPGTCRDLPPRKVDQYLAEEKSFAWRLNSQLFAHSLGALDFRDEFHGRVMVDPIILGDVVLGRKDGALSYHLCSVFDDYEQGVTLIVRGEDLLPSTHIHRMLQKWFDYPSPQYAHHPLLVNASGQRLSKRDGALSLRAMRQNGTNLTTLCDRLPSWVAA